jgi:glycerophosphoryl diester phosphodiesterase
MSNRFRNMALVVSMFAAGCIGAHAQASKWNYNAYHIMDTIRTRHPDLVMLAAHRGIHALWGSNQYTTTPENSLESIQNAADNGIEIVELDIRLTQDGVPILTHDSTWGRETDVGWAWGACSSRTGCFNPWGPLPGLTVSDGDPGELGGGADAPTDSQKAVNPDVNSWSLYSVQQAPAKVDSSIHGIGLRNSFNFQLSPWGENPPTLQNALDYIRSNNLNIVVSLDIKDSNSMMSAWQVVARNSDYKGNPYTQTIFFKFDAAHVFQFLGNFADAFNTHYFSPNAPDSAAMNIMPVYQTSGIASGLYGSEARELLSMQTYVTGSPSVIGTEVNLKQNPGILSSLYNWGDTSGQGGSIGRALGNFNPYAEYIAPGADQSNYNNYKYFYSNGYCCAYLPEYFYNGAPNGQPSDTADQRPDWNFILANRNGFNLITTDNVLPMGLYLYNRGQRNGSYFQ